MAAGLLALSHPSLKPYTGGTVGYLLRSVAVALPDMPKGADRDVLLDLLRQIEPEPLKDRLLAPHRDFAMPFSPRFDLEAARMRGAALLYHPDLQPLADLVSRLCPDDTAFHMGHLFAWWGGLDMRLALLSPYAPLISSEDWLASGRFEGDLLRQLRPNSPEAFEAFSAASPCLAHAMTSASGG